MGVLNELNEEIDIEKQENLENPEGSDTDDLENSQDEGGDDSVNDDAENDESSEVSDDDPDEGDGGGLVITLGDSEVGSSEEDKDPPDAPAWVKKVREVNREQGKEIKQLKRQLAESSALTEAGKPIEIGEKPTLKNCNYKEDEFEEKLNAYQDRKRQVETQVKQKAKVRDEQNAEYKGRQDLYVSKKQKHNFKDFASSEELVINALSDIQQGILVQESEDSALLVYALGKLPKELEELSKVTDPLKYSFKLAKLESQLKVKKRKAPDPEQRLAGGNAGGLSGNSDKTLARLETRAEKSGDRTEIVKYKRSLRKKDK